MTGSLVLVGGGGHAKVVLTAAVSAGRTIAGFLDDHSDAALRRLDVACLGSISAWSACDEHSQFIPALGDNLTRSTRMLEILEHCDLRRLATVIHSTAIVSPHDVTIGAGTFIGPGAIVNPGARIGIGVIINSGAIVEHDVVVGDWAHIGPGAALGGAARVETRALVGLGSCVLLGRTIGHDAIVGAGAVVTRDVVAASTVRGAPAREW